MTSGHKPYDLVDAECDYPEWDGPPRRSVLVCTHPRSGSTLLGESLYFAGDLGCPLEYFHAGFRPRFEARWNAYGLDSFANAVWRSRTGPGGVLSVKLMWRDIQELALEEDSEVFAELDGAPPEAVAPEIYRRLAALVTRILPSPTCIHLYRRDRLRQAVSAMIATQTGQWRSIPGAEMTRLREPDYDEETVIRLIGYSDFCHGHWRNLIAAMETPSYAIAYEDLVRDYAGQTGQLLASLGSSGLSSPVRMRRQADAASEAFVMRFLQERGVPAA